MSVAIGGAVALAVGVMAAYLAGSVHFVNNACSNIEALLPHVLVGQDLALRQLTDAVCDHIAQKQPRKPLVISVHGPPGVGKTYTHLWLARSLYNKQPAVDLQCPGQHCKGYKVVYGVDYLVTEAASRLDALKREVVSQLSSTPDSLLVVEEYDKLDCEARGLWRQLLQHPERANITSNRAIILMESNLGMAELEELLTQIGDRDQVSMASAEQLLRGVVFAQWRGSQCEPYEDTLKLMSLIDIFLPYLPLEKQHMPALVELALQERARLLQQQRRHVRLQWQSGVAEHIANKVDLGSKYPLDGAKVVQAALTRQVGRPLRQAAALPGCKVRWGCNLTLSVDENSQLKLSVRNNTAPGSKEL